MANPINGMVAVISNYGVGKTTFALECGYLPKDIIFINDDVKGTGLDHAFNTYIDLVSVSKKIKIFEFHNYCLDLVSSLPRAKVIIWDTWTQFQSTFPIYVKTHLNEFRNPLEWSPKGNFKGGEIHQDAYRYEGAILSTLKEKCDLLILTFHLKQYYFGEKAVPGKFKPGHDRAIEKYADMRIWLTPNPDSQVPIGLVMKNISKREITEDDIKTDQILPLRLPVCNWKNILEYWENPIGARKLREDERPNSFELSLIEGILTPEDKRMYEANLSLVEKQEEQDKAEILLVKQSQERVIKEYISGNLDGMPNPAKVNRLKSAIEAGELIYDGEISISKVSEWS